jgi:hypothetical protein
MNPNQTQSAGPGTLQAPVFQGFFECPIGSESPENPAILTQSRPNRSSGLRDAARIAEEIVQHLTGIVRADVEITIEINADLPDGASDKTIRDVTENCRTLKFTDFGFEEDLIPCC